jgi:hypothetical protein
MSGGGAGGKGAAAPVPAGSRKLVQGLKEIVNRPEAEIYAALRECGMDPDEAVSRLLSQGPWHGLRCPLLSPSVPRFLACLAVRCRARCYGLDGS